LGTIVVEGDRTSGAMITARFAMEQGKEVFAVPGQVMQSLSAGPHWLIRQGAKLVETVEDELEELGGTPTTPRQAATAAAPAGGDADRILAALGHDPCPIDELARRTGLTADVLLAILFELELAGRVASRPGGFHQRLD
jgi:DNA processing protein